MKRLLAPCALLFLLALPCLAAGPDPEPRPAARETTAAEALPQSPKPASERGLFGGLLTGLLVLGGVFLLARLFVRKSRQNDADANREPRQEAEAPPERYTRAQATWEMLRSKPKAGPGPLPAPGQAAGPGADSEAEFLRGAKAVYARITEAVDTRDFADAANFATPEAVLDLRRRAETGPPSGRTAILLLEAKVLEMQTQDGQTQAAVEYQALLRQGQEPQPRTVREVWRFVRPADDPSATWKLSSASRDPVAGEAR